MTDELTRLLHDEADALDVPPPAGATVLARGRQRRRRTRLVTGAVAVVVVLVVAAAAGGVARLGGPDDDRSRVADTSGDAAALGPVFSVGREVYLDGGERSATIDDVTVKSLYYTSAGVLVRHGLNGNSDGGGPQRFSLVEPDGTVRRLGLETEETYHATDPDQPYVAYAQRVDGTVHVYVRDVVRDEQVADVAVPDVRSSFLPVSLDGDVVYLGDGEGVRLVDWRTGEIAESAVLQGNPDVAGGRALTGDGSGLEVVDVDTGATLSALDLRGTQYAVLSPDGRFVAAVDQFSSEPSPLEVYDVDSGASRSLDLDGSWGWTVDGDLFALSDRGVLSSCSAATGRCEDRQLDLPVLPGSIPDEGTSCTKGPGDADFVCDEPSPESWSDYLALGGRLVES